MSAVIIPFRAGQSADCFEPEQREAEAKRLRQARMMHDTEKSVPLALWLVFLTAMPKEQREAMERQLSARSLHGEADVEQALAWVQFAGAGREERREVLALFDRMGGQPVQS